MTDEDGTATASEVNDGKLRLRSAHSNYVIEQSLPRDCQPVCTCRYELNNNDLVSMSRPASLTCRFYQADKQSDDSAISRDDFYETDDEIQQITSQPSIQGHTSRSSSRQSGNKRKRTNTLSADLEVESLLESGAESTCSYDARSLSDFSGKLLLYH